MVTSSTGSSLGTFPRSSGEKAATCSTSRVNGTSTDQEAPSSRTSATECVRSRTRSASRRPASRISREQRSHPGQRRLSQPSSPRSRPAIWTTSTSSRAAPKPSRPRSSSRGSTGWRAVDPKSRTSSRSHRAITATHCSQCPRPRVRTTRRSFVSGSSTYIACRRRLPITARVAATTLRARRAPARSSRKEFSRSARIASLRSSRSQWADRPQVQPFRVRTTGERCERSAIATTCSSSPTRLRAAPVARARGRRSSRTGWRPTS